MKTIQEMVQINVPHHRMTKKGHIALKRTEQTLKRYRRQQNLPSTSAHSEDIS